MNIKEYNFINLNFNVENINKASSPGPATVLAPGKDSPGTTYVIDGIELIVYEISEDFFRKRKGSFMIFIEKTLRPTSIVLTIVLVLVPAFYQSVSAAMIGTETVLRPNHHQNTRDCLHDLISREDIQKILVARGINPHEAKARIDGLSDDELEMISEKIADLPAGGDATGFIIIVGIVIIFAIIIVEYFSEVKMFPQLNSDE